MRSEFCLRTLNKLFIVQYDTIFQKTTRHLQIFSEHIQVNCISSLEDICKKIIFPNMNQREHFTSFSLQEPHSNVFRFMFWHDTFKYKSCLQFWLHDKIKTLNRLISSEQKLPQPD